MSDKDESTVTWIGAPDDVRTGDEALDAIRVESDANHYDPVYGVVRVPLDRWRKAQGYESRGWMHCWADQNDDRSGFHAETFHDYAALKTDLGHVCEIGCGPFTQLKRIIQGRMASRVTLLDPLLNSYKRLRHCPYRGGKFAALPTVLRSDMAESLADFAAFDTIICINVLEHVMDAVRVLENLKRAVKAGGTIIFGERTFNEFDPHITFDMGHPIHLRSPLLDGFRKNFQVLFENGSYFIGIR